MATLSRSIVVAVALCACGGRAGLPEPATPLAATPADAIPDPPAEAEDAPLAIAVRSATLDNGMRVIVGPRPAEGLATAVLLDEAAAGRDLRSTRVVTELMAYAMQDATETDEGVVPRYARHRGFDLRLGVRGWALIAAATFSAERTPAFFEVLDRVIRRPVFRDSRLASLVARRVESIEGELATAEGLLDDRLPSLLYGEADPRHAPLIRARAELESVRPEALRDRHREILDPSSCTLVVVGEVDPERVVEAARAHFGAWPPHPSAPRLAPAALSSSPVRGVGVVRPLLRPWIGVLERAPGLGDPDHAAFLVLAQVLGGMFSSRLNLLVRESETLSYGLGAGYDAGPDGGELRITTAIHPSQVGRLVALLLQELTRVQGGGGGLTERELTIARTRATQELRARLDTTAGRASYFADLVLADLPLTHAQAVLSAIEQLTAEEIQAAARRWIRPARAPIGIVAAREIFESQLSQLPLGRFSIIVPPPRVRR